MTSPSSLPLPTGWNEGVTVGTRETVLDKEKKAAYEGEQRHAIEREPGPPVIMEWPHQPCISYPHFYVKKR